MNAARRLLRCVVRGESGMVRTRQFESTNLPILLLGTLGTVEHRTRLEKLAFLCDMEIFKKIKVYDDWLPYMYGPFSAKLRNDISNLQSQGLLTMTPLGNNSDDGAYDYSLTIDGDQKCLGLLDQYVREATRIYELLLAYNHMDTNFPLMDHVYRKYPKLSSNMMTAEEALNARNGG